MKKQYGTFGVCCQWCMKVTIWRLLQNTKKLLKVEQFSIGSFPTSQWQNCDRWSESEWKSGIIEFDYKGWHGYHSTQATEGIIKKSKVKSEKWMEKWHYSAWLQIALQYLASWRKVKAFYFFSCKEFSQLLQNMRSNVSKSIVNHPLTVNSPFPNICKAMNMSFLTNLRNSLF